MKSFATVAAVAALAGVVSAKQCQNITVPVTISARNGKFDQAKLSPATDIDVTNIILGLAQQGTNYTADQLQGYATVGGTYQLATTYCAPDSGAPETVQLLTHGIGFDRSYWDLSYNNYNYSYVNEAVDKYGFATFSHDRLGIGMSSKGEPVNEIQVLLEVAALKALTDKLRAGVIPGVPCFKKVLHVGHSFGSVQSYVLTAQYPTISDGLGLTGFSQNGSFLADFLLGGNFRKANAYPQFASLPNGYLAPASVQGVHINFFAPGDFDPALLPIGFMTGQPVTIGELLTIGGAAGSPNPIKAPVHIITGERDVPFCGGNCLAPPTGFKSIPETSKANFKNAAPFKVSIIPGAGHGLNLQYTHVQTYKTILDFFVQNGVGPNGKGGNAGGYKPPHGGKPKGY
ncbi:putative alpha/beta hydrolase-1 [Septoria linicola]|nr:putative alpha/beta hydrolase-1 [Septoria linicola]